MKFDEDEEIKSVYAQLYDAPSGFAARVIAKRNAQRRHRVLWMERIAAVLLLAVSLSGMAYWQHRQNEEKQAAMQLMTALRVTNHALDNVSEQMGE